jgi:hypothetical protein
MDYKLKAVLRRHIGATLNRRWTPVFTKSYSGVLVGRLWLGTPVGTKWLGISYKHIKPTFLGKGKR